MEIQISNAKHVKQVLEVCARLLRSSVQMLSSLLYKNVSTLELGIVYAIANCEPCNQTFQFLLYRFLTNLYIKVLECISVGSFFVYSLTPLGRGVIAKYTRSHLGACVRITSYLPLSLSLHKTQLQPYCDMKAFFLVFR